MNSSYVNIKDRGVLKCEFGGDIVVELDISTRVAFLLDQRVAIPNLKEPAPCHCSRKEARTSLCVDEELSTVGR